MGPRTPGTEFTACRCPTGNRHDKPCREQFEGPFPTSWERELGSPIVLFFLRPADGTWDLFVPGRSTVAGRRKKWSKNRGNLCYFKTACP